jgi:primosomal protein N''
MKIDESSVILKGRHSFESECKTETCSTFRTIFDNAAEASEVSQATAANRPETGEKIHLLLEKLIAEIVALISGQSAPKEVNVRDVLENDSTQSPQEAKPRLRRATEFEWESTTTETIREHESSDFSASGVIRTSDGKSIDFKVDLAMCRDFQCTRKKVDSGKVTLRDPLVINFDGKAAELASTRFNFDLDADGKAESVQGLASGSAFLALDRNGDGQINDGRELFGARSGDGFADLAAFDSDGNHWLDEADAAFAELKVWSRDADGKDSLGSLKESGVGAIYLGATETPFSLKDSDNHLRGQVRASSVYLREDGRAGTLQQIDLAV